MGESSMEEMTLPSPFQEARKIHSAASESSVDQETLKKGIEVLRHCDEMVSRLGLFSSNETKDDVSTANLKYLLVPFYLGELTEKLSQDDRLPVLKISQDQLKEFISICEALELVPEEEIENSTQGGADTAAARRAKKIARFKRQRAAETKLQEIKEKKERRGRQLRATALSTPIEVGEEDVLDDDSEEEREAWLTTISLAICKAFDLVDMLKKEEEMLLAVKEKGLKVDTNGKGKLNYGEFAAISLHLQKIANDEHLRRAFSYFDKDENGYIEPEELREALAEDGALDSMDVAIDILQEVDTDKDGRISYEEFAAMMKTGTDWRKASRHYSRGRFNSLSVKLMREGSVNMSSV